VQRGSAGGTSAAVQGGVQRVQRGCSEGAARVRVQIGCRDRAPLHAPSSAQPAHSAAPTPRPPARPPPVAAAAAAAAAVAAAAAAAAAAAVAAAAAAVARRRVGAWRARGGRRARGWRRARRVLWHARVHAARSGGRGKRAARRRRRRWSGQEAETASAAAARRLAPSARPLLRPRRQPGAHEGACVVREREPECRGEWWGEGK
jgi:hypothetical protein